MQLGKFCCVAYNLTVHIIGFDFHFMKFKLEREINLCQKAISVVQEFSPSFTQTSGLCNLFGVITFDRD